MTAGLLHAAVLLTAQTNWPWAVKSSGSAIEEGWGIASDGSDNSYVTGIYQSGSAVMGSTTLASLGGENMFLEKLDNSGNVLWAVRAGGSLGAAGIKVTTNVTGSDVFVVGRHRGSITFYSTDATIYNLTAPTTSDNCFIARYNSSGVIQWATTYGGVGNDRPHAIAISNASQLIYVTGHTDPPASSDAELFTVCLDYTGSQKWDIVSTSSAGIVQGWGIAADAAGNSYSLVNYEAISSVTLPSGTYTGTDGMLLMKTNINGVISWVKNFGSSSAGVEKGRGVKLDNVNNIYIAGNYNGTASISPFSLSNAGSGTTDIFEAKCDNSGTVLWAKSIGGTGNEYITDFGLSYDGTAHLLAINVESNTVTVGCQTYTSMPSTTDNKFFVAKIKSDGYVSGSGSARVGNAGSQPNAICVDNLGYAKVTGGQQGSVIFGTITLAAATRDAFVAKIEIWDETPLVTSPVNVCVGQTASLSAYVLTGSPTFNWYDMSNTLVGTGSPYVTHVFSSPSSTTYSVSASYPGGCVTAKVPVQVTANAYTTLLASADQTICPGSCATITFANVVMATLNPGGMMVSSPFTVCPTATTTYSLTNATSNLCQIGDQVKVTLATPLPFLGTYSASVFNPGSCTPPMTSTSKDISLTANITTAMPTGTNLANFRCAIGSTASVGWLGAGSVGVNNLTFTSTYTVDVYEVDITGTRLTGAPSVFLIIGTGPSVGDINFNSAGNGAGFDAANPPYFVDGGEPADPAGIAGGGDYFKNYYLEARANGTLTAFSAKVFCVDLKQTTADGCAVAKKSFFRIANANFSNSYNAKQATGAEGPGEGLEFITEWEVYPNPSAGIFNIRLESLSGSEQIQVLDYTGKAIRTLKPEGAEQTLDLSGFARGIYFVKLSGNGISETRKIVLE